MDIMEFKYWVLLGCLGVMMIVLRWVFNFATGKLIQNSKVTIAATGSTTTSFMISTKIMYK